MIYLLQVCDTIPMHAKERFSFTQHFISMESCSNNTVWSSLMQHLKRQCRRTPCWTRPSSKRNCPSSMITASSRLAVVQCLCTSFSWRTTFRALSQGLSVFSGSLSPHPWQKLNLRGASLLWRGSRPSWETPCHRIASMLWLCSPWRKNLSGTFLTLIIRSLRGLPPRRKEDQNSSTNKLSKKHARCLTTVLLVPLF